MRKTYNAPKAVVNDIEAESKFALTISKSMPENDSDSTNNQFSKNDFSVWYDDKDEDDEETTYKVSSIWDE